MKKYLKVEFENKWQQYEYIHFGGLVQITHLDKKCNHTNHLHLVYHTWILQNKRICQDKDYP